MAVRIVSREPHATVVKQVVCQSCGYTLEYTPYDIEKRIFKDYTGDSEVIRYIECPNCKEKVTV